MSAVMNVLLSNWEISSSASRMEITRHLDVTVGKFNLVGTRRSLGQTDRNIVWSQVSCENDDETSFYISVVSNL